MSGIEAFSPKGMLHEGWSAQVDDYAIVCGWALQGKTFLVGDVLVGFTHLREFWEAHLANKRHT